MSAFMKAIIGVLTGLITYLTPKLKQWIDSYISDRAFSKLDTIISNAIKAKSYLVDIFLRDKKLTKEEIEKFVNITKSDIIDEVTPGMRSTLKKTVDIDKFIVNKLTSYIMERALKGGIDIENNKKDDK